MKGYDYLKEALDGKLEPKTIIKTRHEITDEDLGKVIDTYDYYIYQNDNMFHRCNKDGKLGAKYQDRFLNYKVLEKDFEFYCVLEEEKKIPENNFNYIYSCEDEHIMANFHNIKTTLKDIIDYLKSKGE